MSISRRSFLKTSALVAAPCIIPTSARGATAPSRRLTAGFIGVGGRSTGHLRGYVGLNDVQVLAVCDVDARRLAAAQQLVETAYAQRPAVGTYKGCAAYKDFRELLARDDIDLVVIGTPDHWHSLISAAAAKSGKDIYCEKPLTVFIGEGRPVIDAVRRYGRVLQVGSQERSSWGSRHAVELVRNGRIGALRRVTVKLPVAVRDCGQQPEMPIPEGFDYDMWLGPAPLAPYTQRRTHGSFRYILDYSGGEMTDRGAHVGDIAMWGAYPFLKGPVEIQGKGKLFNSLYDTAYEFRIDFAYANGVNMVVTSEGNRGILFEGDDGWVHVEIHGSRLTASRPSLLSTVISPQEIRVHRSSDHRQDFLDAVRTRGQVVAPPDEGHRSAMLCHLSNIALLLGRKLTWDPARERFINDPEADRMTYRPMRSPWTF